MVHTPMVALTLRETLSMTGSQTACLMTLHYTMTHTHTLVRHAHVTRQQRCTVSSSSPTHPLGEICHQCLNGLMLQHQLTVQLCVQMTYLPHSLHAHEHSIETVMVYVKIAQQCPLIATNVIMTLTYSKLHAVICG